MLTTDRITGQPITRAELEHDLTLYRRLIAQHRRPRSEWEKGWLAMLQRREKEVQAMLTGEEPMP